MKIDAINVFDLGSNALAFTVAFAWNNSFKNIINTLYPLDHDSSKNIRANLIYLVFVTIIVIIIVVIVNAVYDPIVNRISSYKNEPTHYSKIK